MLAVMAWVLFPGRHHLLTRFQLETLARACRPGALRDAAGRPFTGRVDGIIWAVTSANHAGTRRNPLPAHRREAAIERAAAALPARSLVYHVDDRGATPRFAEYVLKQVEVDSGGRLRLTPRNTVVGCSTPEVIAQYEKLGFRILPFELADRATGALTARTPWQVLESLVASGLGGGDWRTDEAFARDAAPESRELYLKYGYGDLLLDLHRKPVLTEDGDLTATRDYNTYARAFDEGAERKYEQIKDLVVPGRIVDIGCCAGAVLRLLSRDDRLRESDLYGIEVARPLYAECLHRKERGDFGQSNVFFYQADAVGRALFSPRSVSTFTTFALTHEVESYHGRAALRRFVRLLRRQLAPGGRWLNVDVVGPEDKEKTVWMGLNRDDGTADGWDKAFKDRARLRDHLEKLSTYGRFLRFARDFRKDYGGRLRYEADPSRPGFVRLRLRDACEFLSKKDYTDNWDSELHETFCFWSLSDWKAELARAGLRAHEGSRAFTNPWLVENRYRGRVELLREGKKGLEPLPYPVTNMRLVAENPGP